jgi:hydroxymethylbilane synthase
LGEYSVPTRTTCRIGSDVDLLSRVQLEEVLRLLETSCPVGDVDFVTPVDFPQLKESKMQPNSPARVALLMNGLVENRYDALVLDAAVTPSRLPSGITIGAITCRLTPYEALICREEIILDELAENAVLAANGARREAQMHYYRPDLQIVHARGSVDSLIQRVHSSKIDAAVVAAADMERLGKQEIVVELLTNAVCVPAAGQGALAVLVRSGEEQYTGCLRHINDAATYCELYAEWAFLDHLGLDGAHPVGVLARTEGNVLELEGVLAYPDGREKIHFMVKGLPGQEKELGGTLAQEILKAGGREILQELHLL